MKQDVAVVIYDPLPNWDTFEHRVAGYEMNPLMVILVTVAVLQEPPLKGNREFRATCVQVFRLECASVGQAVFLASRF